MKVKYLTSIAKKSQSYNSNKPEIAIVGRSNVGKSSLINALANANVARTSKMPGRTKMINFYDFGNYCLVDLPGYGFAKTNKQEQINWKNIIEEYFLFSKNLKHVLLLIDSRLNSVENDKEMINFLFFHNISFSILATKIDKIAKSKRFQVYSKIANTFKLGRENVLGVSCYEKIGIEDVLKRINQFVDGENNENN